MLVPAAPLTFQFTDIVGSTHLWQRHPESMPEALAIHDEIIRETATAHAGAVFAGGGDGFGLVFDDPSSAVDAAVEIQRQIQDVRVAASPLLVRIGIHTGTAQRRNGDYFGLSVNRAARVAAAANGGQVLVTEVTAALVDLPLMQLGTYRFADLLEPITVYQAGEGEFGPIKALDPDKHNLPVRFTSIVGRDDLVAETISALDSARLVTLVGPGGIGKTTLAIAVAAETVDQWPHGAWFAPLDDLTTPPEVGRRFASSLNLSFEDGWQQTASVRRQLLVIDNAEHLIDTVADEVADLLRAGPGLRILVTSREPLGIPGERVVSVEPLRDRAVMLDLLRDRSVRVGDDDSAASEIMEMTDGIPLAIELVAAHASRLPLADLLASMRSHGYRPLAARGVSPRHASAHAAVEWSVALLSPEERHAFLTLSIFTQNFTLEDAVAVSGQPAHVVLALAEKSMLSPSASHYRMLEPVKEYAALKRAEEGLTAVAEERLARHVADVVDAFADRLPARPADRWEEEWRQPFGDVHRALTWAVHAEDVELLQRLYRVIPGPFVQQANLVEALFATLDPILPLLESALPGTRWALFRHAWTLDKVGQEPEAFESATRLREVAVEVDDRELVGACDTLLLSSSPRSAFVAVLSMEEADELAKSISDTNLRSDWWDAGGIRHMLGVHAYTSGDLARAEQLFRANVGLSNSWNRGVNLLWLADVLVELGRPHEAITLLDDLPREMFVANPSLSQKRAHAYIAVSDLEAAAVDIHTMVENTPQPTTEPFCAASDYHRAAGDHRAATWFMSRMLGGGPPEHPTHQRIIDAAREALGPAFEGEWERGATMDILSLHGLIREM